MRPVSQSGLSTTAPAARRARVEYTVSAAGLAGTVTFPGRSPLPFHGASELERCLGLGAGALVLVDVDATAGDECDDLATLSDIERAIAQRAVGGESNREIADALYYSVKSVEAYLTRIYRRLGVEGRDGLATLLAAEDLEPLQGEAALVAGGASASEQRPSRPAVVADLWGGRACEHPRARVKGLCLSLSIGAVSGNEKAPRCPAR
jgi:DNA-binding CsgD family transcriptional regulator